MLINTPNLWANSIDFADKEGRGDQNISKFCGRHIWNPPYISETGCSDSRCHRPRRIRCLGQSPPPTRIPNQVFPWVFLIKKLITLRCRQHTVPAGLSINLPTKPWNRPNAARSRVALTNFRVSKDWRGPRKPSTGAQHYCTGSGDPTNRFSAHSIVV